MTETIHLQLLLATFADWICRQRATVITYLIEENGVLKEWREMGGLSPIFGHYVLTEEKAPFDGTFWPQTSVLNSVDYYTDGFQLDL